MKKAFDANVSRAKPRMRLSAMMSSSEQVETVTETETDFQGVSHAAVEAIAEHVARSEAPVIPSMDLSAALRNRQQVRSTKFSAAEALRDALETPSDHHAPAPSPAMRYEIETPRFEEPPAQKTVAHAMPPATVHTTYVEEAPRPVAHAMPQPSMQMPRFEEPARQPVAHAMPPPSVTEVQTAPAPSPMMPEVEPGERRERLKERLRTVRENPRPEPLPETVAEAGVLAVERISALQSELTKARSLNLALAQDLEAARRQAERATEEARLRMDEARRLSS